MAFWVVRAGSHGVNEDYTLESNAIVIGLERPIRSRHCGA
jgi:hypothetical protein